jgi:hypothetical protein
MTRTRAAPRGQLRCGALTNESRKLGVVLTTLQARLTDTLLASGKEEVCAQCVGGGGLARTLSL